MDFSGSLALIIILALIVGLVLRQLTKWRDSESTSSADDASAEENEALRRDSESTSRTDHESGEENEGFDSLGIEHKDSDTTDQMKRKRSTEAIPSMGIEPAYQYDVFLSFCGGDIRLNFTDNLYHRMRDAGICVFLDSEDLKKGKEISEILKAVDESQIYIPIFSQKFASRPWCLREVARMVQRRSNSNGKREIFPIFYDVEPNDVKLISNLYKNDILEHEKKGYFKSEELEQWRGALKVVGRIMGLELKGKRQGKEIESIVKQVLHKLNGQHVDLPGNLVEDHRQIKAIREKLDLNSGGVRFIIIRGLGGIGKTTLAKIVFNGLSSLFECVSFLEEVREKSEDGLKGLVTLQKQLLKDASFTLADQIEDVGEGKYRIKAVCKNKKVLLVLDDLDNEKQLDNLAGKSDWFGSGSRIIITTRNKFIPETQGESSSEEALNKTKKIVDYEVQEMEFNQALRLFCKHAFRGNSPTKDYDTLSQDIVLKVAKLPLAIEAIGSDLYVLGLAKKPYGVTIELLQETLQKLDEGPPEIVQKVLMISYKGLEEKTKYVFLDIACFFINEDQTYPIIMWNDLNYQPDRAIRFLLLRSLIKIRHNKFWMHDQVRDLGRHIILKEHTPKFSRVWKHEDAVELLKRKEGNGDVEALSLTSSGCSHNIADGELVALPKLRFLRAKGSDFSGDFMNLLSKLRWLSWQTWQMTFQAKNFHFSNLVVLDLSDSNIEDDWDGWSQMKMDRLKVLDLTGCVRLKKTPEFSNFMSLKKLILVGCVELTAIDRSIGKLKHLTTLNIKGCRLLGEFPKEVGFLPSLTEVIMPQTFQHFKLSETFGNLKSLLSLILDEHLGITQLPRYIEGLVKVTHLSLRWCVGIKELPCSLGKMIMLVELDLSMSGIVELPDSIKDLKNLKVIRVSCTMIRKFPRTIGLVELLEELHANKCWDLTNENLEKIGSLSHLKILDLSYTRVSRFPTVLGCLSRLQTLGLGSSDLEELPKLPSSLTCLHIQARQFPSIPNLSSLVNLGYLELSSLIVSREEPDPNWKDNSPKRNSIDDSLEKQPIDLLPCNLSTLKCRGIRLLPPLSKNLSVLCVIECSMPYFPIHKELINLTELKLSKCKFIEKIFGLSVLKNLRGLDLNRLDRLVEIRGLSELKSLLYFRISDCYNIERLPNLSKLDKLQRIELEACPKIKAIEEIKGLESLELDNCGCTVLERLQDDLGSTWLSHKAPKCQVFLSFSGPDNSYSIVDVLYKNLVRNQISVFRDDDMVSSGDGTNERLPQALDDSNIYIPILSKNYASSWWCLRELAHMVKCTSNSYGKKIILPIFYDVEVDDVKLESTLYRSALDKHRSKFGNEVEEWEMALREVADIRGFNLNSNGHGELIELVVKEASRKLTGKSVDVPEHLVEDHGQIKAIMDNLDVDSGGVRLVGILGMGGIGKTTLAKVVFNKLLLRFDGVSFLQNIRESSQHSLDGLVNLQKKLLSDLINSRDTIQIKDIGDGMDRIKRVCRTRKVLIVLDDLDKKEQLQKLAGESNWFGSGSRIIITTRDESILKTEVESFSEVVLNEVYEMEFGRALQLFCEHVFRRDSPVEGYEHLAEKIVRRVGMLPLAVVEIGSILRFHREIGEWKDELMQLNKGPLKVVRDALMISYEGLKDEEKEVFLDIACFFTNEDETYPAIMWGDCQSAVSVLLQRSLIKNRDDKFWMHDQLRDLGMNIIVEEYPHKCSRVRIHERAVAMLRERKEINQGLEALSLSSSGGWSSIHTAEELAATSKLRFLRVKGLDGILKNLLPNLDRLSGETWGTAFHANNFHFSNLFMLDLSDSNIGDGWNGWSQMKMAKKLKVLDLRNCKCLTRTPDLSDFLDLEILILAGCSKLITVDCSISKLQLLKTLNMDGCDSVEELPEEVGSLKSLTEFIFSGSSKLVTLIESFGNLKFLSSSNVNYCKEMNKFLNSIQGLAKSTRSSIKGCEGIKKLPHSLWGLVSLVKLDLSFSGIDSLPNSIGNLKKLKTIKMGHTKLKRLPNAIGQLEMLEELHCPECPDLSGEVPKAIGNLFHLQILNLSCTRISGLPDTITHLSHLEELHVQDCRDLTSEIPDAIGALSRLRILDFSSTRISGLPATIAHLSHLEELHVSDCGDLMGKIPDAIGGLSRLRILDFSKTSISGMPATIAHLSHLEELRVQGCRNLQSQIPDAIGGLSRLRILDFSCTCISSLPATIAHLSHLEELHVSNCEDLKGKIPDAIGRLSRLRILDFSRTGISGMPTTIAHLSHLEELRVKGCRNLQSQIPDAIGGLSRLRILDFSCTCISGLPATIAHLSHLEELHVSNCEDLKGKIPNAIGKLSRLRILDFSGTGISGMPTTIAHLSHLEELRVQCCWKLQSQIPNAIGGLSRLRILDFSCTCISGLPATIAHLSHLEELDVSNCEDLKGEIPNAIGKLSRLRILDFSRTGISGMPTTIAHLSHLEELRVKGCRNLQSQIPDAIWGLSCLRILDFSDTCISGLPATIAHLSHLEELCVKGCWKLTGEIPNAIGGLSSLRNLDFAGTRISGLPATISCLACLEVLVLKDCRELRLVPQLPSSLISLILDAYHCGIIPDLSNLVTLYHLNLSFHTDNLKASHQLEEIMSPWKIVESIHRLPSSLSTLHLTGILPPQRFSNFGNLSILSISRCSMAHLPMLELLEKLRELSIKFCPSLKRIPDLSCLKNLKTLYLSELRSLVEIRGLGELEPLESLQIICRGSLDGLPQLSKLAKLELFKLYHCQVLRAIEGLGCLQCLKHLTIMGCMSLERLPGYPRWTTLHTDWKAPETSSADWESPGTSGPASISGASINQCVT